MDQYRCLGLPLRQVLQYPPKDEVVEAKKVDVALLTHYSPVLVSIPPDVFRGYRKAALGCNGLSEKEKKIS